MTLLIHSHFRLTTTRCFGGGLLKTPTMQRIAPNNQLPATNIIEVWRAGKQTPTRYFFNSINSISGQFSINTIAIFRIRENKLPTLHNFNK